MVFSFSSRPVLPADGGIYHPRCRLGAFAAHCHYFTPMPTLIGLVRAAGPLPPDRLRTNFSKACWMTSLSLPVRFSPARTSSAIGLLHTIQSQSSLPVRNSVVSVMISILMFFSPAAAQEQLRGDALVCLACCDQPEDLQLTPGQAMEVTRGRILCE